MKTKQIVALVVAAAIFIVTGITSVITNTLSSNLINQEVSNLLTGGVKNSAPSEDYIAIVRVEGTIQQQTTSTDVFGSTGSAYQHNDTLSYIDSLKNDSYNKGILLYVDSPGGAVYESEELHDKLQEYKSVTGRPIWGYMAHYAASGGYMVSMTADRIFANKNTVTGSIGVIMSGYDLSGLYEKLGIRYISITSGPNKDSSSLNDEQVEIYQSQVNECYESFVNIVANGRNMSVDQVKTLADGRTYTAQQAVANGLIDEIDTYENMVSQMESSLGVYKLYEPESELNLITSLFAKAQTLVPKSEAQILLETAAEKESGVLMYYAEQLR